MIDIEEYMQTWWEEYPHPYASSHKVVDALMRGGYHGVRVKTKFDLMNPQPCSEWCAENTKHRHYFIHPYCFFMDVQDALLFKLTFG